MNKLASGTVVTVCGSGYGVLEGRTGTVEGDAGGGGLWVTLDADVPQCGVRPIIELDGQRRRRRVMLFPSECQVHVQSRRA